jgi:hypothetical protein
LVLLVLLGVKVIEGLLAQGDLEEVLVLLGIRVL